MKIKIILGLLIATVAFYPASAQEGITTFGVCLRPSFPNKFFRTGPKDFSDKNIDYSIVQQSGISFGGLVRHGFTKRLSMETGIIYTKRNYDLTLTDTTFKGGGGFSIIGYEVPVTALVYIQLDEKLWMDAGLGALLNIFPSDVATFKDFYSHYSARRQKVSAGVMANLGIEYRTAKSGYFYLGFVYHRALQTLYDTLIEYYPDRDFTKPYSSIGRTQLEGDYFGIDVKYFFHEDKEKKKKK